eukprot:CAMPEP_0197306566 /NCGR_PEP_ID=MMETSP0891-20130614/3539_1 /TAXON_ID=44058 ORGANISM="Aureoumbra lagunensis, Strain CCMP1510" /NCGR_SAMPLE_ID=MMETSP0891 /ASSEMBLY_ACC=CAM_ASM_000534 /LENGTH=244 /DNA_ID=CAMNT_0042788969 /DNA_START=180 /DNA_END=917 /DNA_ORIENTATION=-
MAVCSAEAIRKSPDNARIFAISCKLELIVHTTSFSGGKLGHDVWPASVALATWVEQNSHRFNSNASVLELGAGVSGLPGLTVASLCNARVTLTDLDGTDDNEPTTIVSTLKRNILANKLELLVQARALDWCDRKDGDDTEVFDFILAADVIYDFSILESLCFTIRERLRPPSKNDAGGRAFLMNTKRDWEGAREPRPILDDLIFNLKKVGCEIVSNTPMEARWPTSSVSGDGEIVSLIEVRLSR